MNDVLKQIEVLYVEDSDDIREIGIRMLQRKVKKLNVGIDGKDGFEKFKQCNPDIIITDITMPNMTGLEMISCIREIDKKIPIVITSTHDEPDILMDSIELGVNGYLLKPLNRKKLLDTIELHSKSIVLERSLKEKERQLAIKNKNEALMDMVENMAHQWRQPLTIISTSADMIKIGKEFGTITDDELLEISSNITSTAQKLSTTIENLRKFIDKNSSADKRFNPIDKIQSSINFIQILLDEQNIEVIIENKQELEYNGNGELLTKSILNILYNCLDAFENKNIEKKYIFIDTKYENDKLIINIKDNAKGIDDKIIDKVFEPYFTTYHQSRGKGLGLYNTYNTICYKMKGDIKIKNINFSYNNIPQKGVLVMLVL